MNDTAYLDMKGQIEIFNGDELIFKEDNAITPEAVTIILNSLGTVNGNIGIDKLRVYVGTTIIEKPITEVVINISEGKVTFTTILVENDFDGYINQLYLLCSPLDKLFSSKTGMNILKDNNMRLKINWNIIINKV